MARSATLKTRVDAKAMVQAAAEYAKDFYQAFHDGSPG